MIKYFDKQLIFNNRASNRQEVSFSPGFAYFEKPLRFVTLFKGTLKY